MRDYLIAGIAAAVIGTLAGPLMQRLANRIGFVDRPDHHHKRHQAPVSLGGGLLLFVSLVIGLAATAAVSPIGRMLLERDAALVRGLLLGTLTLVVIGVVDDWRGMRGRHKLLGQLGAALLLISHGLEVRQLELLGWTVDLGVMAVPFTVFWLVGAINAINLLDGLDGFVGTIGFVTAIVLAGAAVISGQAIVALIAVALAGSCLAFLHMNLPPAKMFLGDTGSMLLGLLLGALVILCCSKGPGLLSLAPAVALLALPILDAGFALLRRRLTGRSIYATDRGHLHHCLLYKLESHYSVLLVAALACASSGVGAALSLYTKNDTTAILCTGVGIAVLVVLRLFGHGELRLLVSKLGLPLAWVAHRVTGRDGNGSRNIAVRLQGDREWNLLWESLTRTAEEMQLVWIDLDVNLPAAREGFHAAWRTRSASEKHECWRVELPLIVQDTVVGRLQVAGEKAGESSVCASIEALVTDLVAYEEAFKSLAADSPLEHASTSFNRPADANKHNGTLGRFPETVVSTPVKAVSLQG